MKYLLTVLLLASLVILAAGHGRKPVGPYTFIVGFLNEPTFQNALNAVQLTIQQTNTSQSISGQAGLVNVTVTQTDSPGESLPLALESVYNQVYYAGYFVPTKAGQYSFHFLGNVLGTDVDVTFTSTADGFEDVRTTSNLVYPPSS